jgi:hypothetical protein
VPSSTCCAARRSARPSRARNSTTSSTTATSPERARHSRATASTRTQRSREAADQRVRPVPATSPVPPPAHMQHDPLRQPPHRSYAGRYENSETRTVTGIPGDA